MRDRSIISLVRMSLEIPYSAISLPDGDVVLTSSSKDFYGRTETTQVAKELRAHFLSLGGNFTTMSDASFCEFASILIARRDHLVRPVGHSSMKKLERNPE
ncbi:hypothetical protein J2T08_003674 [Neorhizobium galegae]|nr:hypothetical protein [Neorhizobium galegae]MDQ0135753.1 hypothetical protein [Neorhizobium galegae]